MPGAKSCDLCPLTDKEKKINLPDNEIIYLGRSTITGITDLYLSRKQLSVQANYRTLEVTAKVLGTTYSECNGHVMEKNYTYSLKHGDMLGLKLGEYQYLITFDPPPSAKLKENHNSHPENKEVDDEEPQAKRSKTNYPIFEMAKNSKSDTEGDEVKGSWEEIDRRCLIFTPTNFKPSSKIASFDLDGTIIRVKSCLQFPKHKDDWEFWNPVVINKLKGLIQDGYGLVIFSNQAAIKQDRSKIKEFKEKLTSILRKLNIPITIFISTDRSIYRKPAPGMWTAFIQNKNSNVDIDYSKSFYVGDAAGRPKNWAPNKKKDHSLVDRLFAENIGLKFYTPDEFFLGSKPVEYIKPSFDPKSVFSKGADQITSLSIGKSLEVIVMVGFPGSGKSHFCKMHLINNGYVYANRDTLGSWQKCVKVVEESLQNKQSVVVDNTNPDLESRKRYINVAKKFNVPCRCFIMKVDITHAKHNNKFREIIDNYIKVTDVIINSYNKQFKEPTLGEGFSEIVAIDFIPEFDDSEKEKLYKMYLLE